MMSSFIEFLSIDRLLLWVLDASGLSKRRWEALEYEADFLKRYSTNGERRIQEDVTPIENRISQLIQQYSIAMDTKCGPILTHISIMIASIIYILPNEKKESVIKYILWSEAAVYVSLAVFCIRCLKISFNIEKMIDRSSLYSAVKNEFIIKWYLFNFTVNLTMAATAALVVTFVIHITSGV